MIAREYNRMKDQRSTIKKKQGGNEGENSVGNHGGLQSQQMTNDRCSEG